jgi:hypothetical protein
MAIILGEKILGGNSHLTGFYTDHWVCQPCRAPDWTCGFLAEINLRGAAPGLGKMVWMQGTPPPPTPPNAALGAGFAKSVGKI